MNINVGSSSTRIPGFLNVDIRRIEGVDIVGHAGAFRGVGDGTVQTLFASAVLEHIFLGQHLAVFAEWKRVLAPDGLIVCIAIPDFAMLARLYLQNAPGIVSKRFDLLNVYRYTHGWPEEALAPVWGQWQPDKHPNAAPAEWLPQLHKALFDVTYVQGLLEVSGLRGACFNYVYGGNNEIHPLNLGFIASARPDYDIPTTPEQIRAVLSRVPGIEKSVALDTIKLSTPGPEPDSMTAYVTNLSKRPLPKLLGLKKIVRHWQRRLKLTNKP